ncbi:hypothetical protein [Actinophytocola sp.]|uniref:hypothetical protein n=1 Tax=Actinophytocola sp. TaxID=1872138 RepID=UPI00389A0DB5
MLGTVALVLGTAIACGRPTDQPERPRAAEGKAPVWVEASCPATRVDPPRAVQDGGGIPADFTPVAVMRCREETRRIPGEGSWVVRVTERADAPVPDLVDMLRRPSDPPPPADTACTLELRTVPYFVLVDAGGRALLPAVPTTACGQPREEVPDFLDTLTYRTVTETRVRPVESQLSVDTGCAEYWKDLIAILGPTAEPSPAQPRRSVQGSDIHVCVYRADGDTGQLESGSWVTGRDASALRTTMEAAGPAARCDKPHTRFAVLLDSSANSGMPAVELDGCFRFQRPDQSLGQLDAAAVAVLTR